MAENEHRPWDPGLQLERTTLAWFRTAVALLAGSVIVVRLAANRSVLLAGVIVVLALPLATLITWLAGRRHARSDRRLRQQEPLPDGRLHVGMAALGCILGCAGLAFVLLI